MEYLKLHNPRRFTLESFSFEEAAVPGWDNDKPSLAVLSETEMLLFTNHADYEESAHGGGKSFHSVMFRSHDGGRTWGEGAHTPFLGYEPSATVIDGVLFVQTHLLPQHRKGLKNCIGLLYRSEDGGNTWTETVLDEDYLGIPGLNGTICPTRNLVKLPGGELLLFVWGDRRFQGRLLSRDMGRTWEFAPVSDCVQREGERPLLCESYTFVTPSGRLMAVTRIDPSEITDAIPCFTRTEKFDTDEGDGMLLIESKDQGLSWTAVRGLGGRGMMYPGVVYTDGTHFLLTYSQRVARVEVPYPHSGVQAIFGTEEADGSFTVNFEEDLLILDDKTPDEALTGNGFGYTQLLPDGGFITPYCFAELTPEFHEMLRQGECYQRDDIISDYFRRSGSGEIDLPWWQNSTPEWKRVIMWEWSAPLHLWHPASRVMRWRPV